MQIGLIGLQNSGKTTLYNTLSGNDGSQNSSQTIVRVPDKRLDELTKLFNPKKQVNAILEVIDIPGLQVSDNGKVKITSDFLTKVKNNDLLLHIVRDFNNESVPHPEGKVNSINDISFIDTEFLLTDLGFVESRLEKIEKELHKNKLDKLVREKPLFERFKEILENEKPLRDLELDEAEEKLISGYQLLTIKPMIIGVNFSDDAKNEIDSKITKIKENFPYHSENTIAFMAQFEYELSQLTEEDSSVFMDDMGIKESALSRILESSYRLLGLQSFFTVGEDECRAWTIKKGYTAQQSAGVIHSDFFNKFIRAEVVHYDDYMKYGSFAKCKEAGVWRLEGKEYIVKDGDILNIRHS